MKKILLYKHYFADFMQTLPEKARLKVDYTLNLLATLNAVPAKFMRHMGDSLFELRVEYASNIYRIFFVFDDGDIVVLFNGFTKKTQKTPPAELEKARRLKTEYFKEKYG